MVGNVRPDAELREDGGIEIGDDARLLPDTSPRGAGRWTLDTPRERELPAPEGLGDSHGYGRAFPEGMPFGAERRALDLTWSLGRRLRSEEHTSELQSRGHLVCRLLLEKKNSHRCGLVDYM